MKVNSPMRDLLRVAPPMEDPSHLPDDARAVLEAGWTVGPSGSLLLRSLWHGRRASIAGSDVGQYEYEINDVYISLTDLGDDMSSYLAHAVSRGIFLATTMLRKAKRIPGSDDLVAAVAVFVDMNDEAFLLQGARVRFFTRRGDYPTWFEDLERFELQAMAVIDISDVLDDSGTAIGRQ